MGVINNNNNEDSKNNVVSGTRKRYRRDELDEEEQDNPWLNALRQESEDKVEIHEDTVNKRSSSAINVEVKEQAKPAAAGGGGYEQQVKAQSKSTVSVDEPESRVLKQSLLAQKAKHLQENPYGETEQERVLREEADIMNAVTKRKALKGHHELAQGIEYAKHCVVTGWKPPLRIRRRKEEKNQKIREKHHIICQGHDIPPPVSSFEDMKLPKQVLRLLESKGISAPTPIQMQGLPVLLSGRDMIGIATTGSGKTMVFSLPLVMLALQEELRMPVEGGEGPLGLILCPSRELARQTHDIIEEFAQVLMKHGEYPEIRTLLAIGGLDNKDAIESARRLGVHIVVATPGRLKDLLKRRRINLDICRYFCLDEADRMVDLGFEDDIRDILSFFKDQRQMAMFSATMPAKIKTFAESALNDPIEVNVGRAGSTNVNITQEIEYVKSDERLVAILDALQKTPPPVLIFAENKKDVDIIHEFLLVKGVEAVAVHGSKDQQERLWAFDAFRAGKKDVLIATDVASKGLDFPQIEHVINFDMPEEIENYVHRIGRTGRRGQKGVATTFLTRETPESAMLDLKHVLKEAKQFIPPVLQSIHDPMEEYEVIEAASGTRGCAYCGGLGHRLADCPKLRSDTREQFKSRRDGLAGSGYGAEM